MLTGKRECGEHWRMSVNFGTSDSLSASQFGLPPETASEGIWTAIEVQTSIEPLMREAQPNSKVVMP
jgi:hypothetical protein